VESFGARLKREREKKGVTLDDISLSTKIGTRLLRALEDEHFDQLPGGIFNKGFVRAYARHLGLDEDQAVADYLAASGETPPGRPADSAVVVAAEEEQEEPASGVERIPWGVLAGALLVVALGFAIWGFNSRDKERETREASPQPSQQTRAPGSESAQPSSSSLSEAAPAAGGKVPVSPPPSTVAPAAAPSTAEFVVLIKAQDDSWLSITADGQHIMEGELAAGSEKSIHAQKSISLRAGNVGGLDFYFNGKKLPSQGEQAEVKQLTFSGSGLEAAKPVAVAPAPQPQ